MNFIFVNIPLRSKPGKYPPVGVTSLLETLIREGYEPKFFDIDALRPSFEKVIEYFKREQPDILGISAVVSTAYRYTKELSHAVKLVSPNTKIILGGCLAASSEIILRKCPIDLCVVGEGEKVLSNIMKHWQRYGDFLSGRDELKKIKGLAFIDENNDFIFTGYEDQLLPKELSQPNYDLLAKFSGIDCYIRDPLSLDFLKNDEKIYQPHRKGQKACYILTSKGCTSRCTFCHRWVKGYRTYPIENVINTIKYLKEKFNVGFFSIGDETFGADPRFLNELIEAIKPLDILFRIAGIRVLTVYNNPDIVRRLKEAGCVQMRFGMESGSDKILKLMEKGVTAKQNLEVAKLLLKEKMQTVHQLVIGMPGENDDTINETIECLKSITEQAKDYPYNLLSINYFQALPGTTGYEFIRSQGLLGRTLEDEEAYLLKISDTNAGHREHYINVSEGSLSKVLFLWPYKIRTQTTMHWFRKRGWRYLNGEKKPLTQRIAKGSKDKLLRIIWYNIRGKKSYFIIASFLGGIFWQGILFTAQIHLYGIRKTLLFLMRAKSEDDRSKFIIKESASLRKFITHPDPDKISVSEKNMLFLRMGR